MFEKNLEALRDVNPTLAEELENTPLSDKVQVFLGPNQDINIAYEQFPLHDIEDPMGEALELFNKEVPEHKRSYQDIYFMFGLGLGYLARRAFVDSEAIILVFEPHLDILRTTLEAVDFSEEIRSKRLMFMTSTDNVLNAVSETFMLGDGFITMALPNYNLKYPEIYLKTLEELRGALLHARIGQNTVLHGWERFTRMSLENLPTFLQYPEFKFLHDKFEGKPGVVVSAGPSIDNPGVLETLKDMREHLVIACVGQAAKALDRAGIVPDLLNIVECQDVSSQIDGVSYLDDTNLVLLPQTHKNIYSYKTKRKLITHSNRDPLTGWLSTALDEALFGYSHQGTVSYTCLIELMLMGCSPIFMIGQDLAYPEGKFYAKHSIYKGIYATFDENGKKVLHWPEEVKQATYGSFWNTEEEFERMKQRWLNSMIETKGWNGEKLFTSTSYEAFRKAFEGMRRVQDLDKHILVNCSEGGAYIEGYEHMPFPEAVKHYNVSAHGNVKQTFDSVMDTEYEEQKPFSDHYQKVYDRFMADKQDLLELDLLADESLEDIERIEKDLERKNIITDSIRSRIKKMAKRDPHIIELCSQNQLINAYIKKDIFQYTRTYKRKLALQGDDTSPMEDVTELKENLAHSKSLYNAVKKGTDGLLTTMQPVMEDFPAKKSQGTTENTPMSKMTPITGR